LLAGAVFSSLAFASSAFASFAPKLVASSVDTGSGATRIGVVISNSDDPSAKVSIYVPTAYTVGTPAARTKLGDVTATASAADLLSASFVSSAITQPAAAADYRWTSLWTPYNPGKGTVNAAGSVEVQSIRPLPLGGKLNVTKKKVTKTVLRRIKGKVRKVKI